MPRPAIEGLRYRRDLAGWLDCSLEDVTSACLEAVAADLKASARGNLSEEDDEDLL